MFWVITLCQSTGRLWYQWFLPVPLLLCRTSRALEWIMKQDVMRRIKVSIKTSEHCQASKQYMSLKYFHGSIFGLGLTRGHSYSAVPLLPLTLQKSKQKLVMGRVVCIQISPLLITFGCSNCLIVDRGETTGWSSTETERWKKQGRSCREEAHVSWGVQPSDGLFTQQSKWNDKPEPGLLERGARQRDRTWGMLLW